MEIVDISSDSNDTIIVNQDYLKDSNNSLEIRSNHIYEINYSDDEDLSLEKNRNEANSNFLQPSKENPSLENMECDELISHLHKKYMLQKPIDKGHSTVFKNKISSLDEKEDIIKKLPGQHVQGNEETSARQEKERTLEKILKEELQQLKKNEKILKNIQKTTSKDECIKNIVVDIDESIIDTEYGEIIISVLKDNSVLFNPCNSFLNHISWTRKNLILDNLILRETEHKEKHHFFIISSKQFTKLIREDKVMMYMQDQFSKTEAKHLTIAVYGINKFADEHENAITESEMFFNCHWQCFNSNAELASFVMMVTKAVAQIPYKLELEEKHKLQSEYICDSNKDTVRVDKNGNGLSRLWRQMLVMFPLARLETAEAITAVYPTPTSLFEAYEHCQEREEMLQELPIRRAYGPLVSVKRLGPELSKKTCTHFTSTINTFL